MILEIGGKILDALRLYIGTGHVSGLVEADETFFRLSYKGNHSKSKGFTMPRKPYLRGPKSKKSENEEPKPRGISRNQVAVMCVWCRETGFLIKLRSERYMMSIKHGVRIITAVNGKD